MGSRSQTEIRRTVQLFKNAVQVAVVAGRGAVRALPWLAGRMSAFSQRHEAQYEAGRRGRSGPSQRPTGATSGLSERTSRPVDMLLMQVSSCLRRRKPYSRFDGRSVHLGWECKGGMVCKCDGSADPDALITIMCADCSSQTQTIALRWLLSFLQERQCQS
jgi:hypothetical protein